MQQTNQDKTYDEYLWLQIRERFECFESHISFIEENCAALHLKDTKTFLSIGAGDGKLECYMASNMPKLSKLICVEPSDLLFNECQDKTSCLKEVQVMNVKKTMEDYSGPSEPVDLVLLAHVLYHTEDLKMSINRSFEWLAPGGVLFIIIRVGEEKNLVNAASELRKIGMRSKQTERCSQQVKEVLCEMNFSFTEVLKPYKFLMHAGPDLSGFIQFLTSRPTKLTKTEEKEVLDILKPLFEPGTDEIVESLSCITVTKPI